VPDWIDEIDLSLGGAPVRMGTRNLPEDRWLVPDHLAPSELALRRRLLAEQRGQVFACRPPAEEAAAETAELVARWLDDRGLADEGPADETHPLAQAGRRVQEDLCLMVHHHGDWHLEGAVLCFPSLWSLADKLGRPTAAIHAPVPHYAEALSGRVDTFFDRLAPGKLVWRRNVSLWPHLLLWAPCRDFDGLAPVADPARWWLRSERQTLRRLPLSDAILFTIRVQTVPLAVLAGRPDRARALSGWLQGAAGATRRSHLGEAADDVVAWLERISRVSPPTGGRHRQS
jgi:hypothetical protein